MVAGETLLPHRFLYAPHGHPCRIYPDEGFLHAAFTPAIPLYERCFKGDPLEPGHLEGDISGGGNKVPAVVAAVVTLPLLIALVPGRLCQLFCFGIRQFVKCFLHAASHKFLKFAALDYFLV